MFNLIKTQTLRRLLRSQITSNPAQRGYGLMMLIIFITSTVLIGASIQMVLGSGTSAYLGTEAQDYMAAKEVAQSGMEVVLADIQANLNAGTTVDTSYTYSSAAHSTSISMPNDPAALGGGTTQIGPYTATITSARGNTYLVNVVATVNSTTYAYSKLFTMGRVGGNTVDNLAGGTANAMYGLRKLRSAYGGSAIRVRSSIDNTEQDIGFDGNGNLDMDSLKTFLSVSNPPLTVPTVAFGLRRLRAAYTGSAINVRRSSDSTTQDIGFNAAGDLDVNALMTFVGAGTGYVTKWYDQSGNGTDASQGTAANQPTIVTAGVLNRVANRPAILYDGVSDNLSFTRTISDDFTIMTSYSAIAGYDTFANSTDWYGHAALVDADISFSNNDFGMSIDSAGYVYAGVGNPDTTLLSQTTNYSVATPGLNDGRMHWAAMWRNKSTGAFGLYEDRFSYYGPNNTNTNTNSLTAPTNIYIGGNGHYLNGYVNEVIIYNSKLSETSLRTVERNAAWYYNMPLHQWTGWQYPLDRVGSSTAAYSLRLVRSAYAGNPFIKVRRSSDNTTLDVGADNTGYNLDVKSLLAFVGNGSGYIDTWYDQSGNGRHATQATTSKQPRIVNAGALDTQSGKPSIYFASGNYLSTAAFTAFGSGYHVQAIAKASSNYVNENALVTKSNNNNYAAPFDFHSGWHMLGNGSSTFTSQSFTSSLTSGNPYWVFGYDGSSTSMHTWVNGLNAGSTTGTLTYGDSGRGMFIGSREDLYTYLNGYIGEIITYGAQLSAANRQWLEQNELQYFAPPIPTAFVTKWYDQSVNGYDAVQVNPIEQPTLVMPMYGTFNNRPTINFNGNQYLYTTGGMPTSADYSIATVFSYFAIGTGNIVSDTVDSHAFYMNTGNNLYLYHAGTFAGAGAAYTMTTNTNYAVCGTYVNSTGAGKTYVFNSLAGSGTRAIANTSSGIQFGAHNGLGRTLYGTISEAMVFSRVLTAADRTAIYNDERGYYAAQ